MLKGIGVYLGRHHLALLALFVALGGTSLAASNALLPRNSVGTAQLKKNSVSAAKLRNGAVTKAKIDKSTLVALKGNKGAQGVPGPQGAQGPAGSPDTPAQVLGKLVQVDGAGSGLDADKLDGLSSADFLKVGSAAGGGLTGTYPNPAIAADSISGANIVNGSLTAGDVGSRSGSFTFNSGSVAAHTCGELSLVAGGSMGDPVVIAADATVTNLIVVASSWRLVAGTTPAVAVQFCNVSAAPIDPPSMTFSYVIFAKS